MNIEQEIADIKLRNQAVELDKAWETSIARRISIGIMTYIFMVILFWVLESDSPFTNAFVPTFGYLLSTFGMNSIRKLWIKTQKN